MEMLLCLRRAQSHFMLDKELKGKVERLPSMPKALGSILSTSGVGERESTERLEGGIDRELHSYFSV